jgi:hypothetical protein
MAKYDEAEAGRILGTFARERKILGSGPKPDEADAFLARFADLARKSGLRAGKVGRGFVELAFGERTLTVSCDLHGNVGIADRNDVPALPIAWNPGLGIFEGTEHDAESPGERRSALAVLAEEVVKRLNG